MITTVRCSALPSANDCLKRVLALGTDRGDPADDDPEMETGESRWAGELADRGFKFKRLPPGIAAVVGTSAHAGSMQYLSDRNKSAAQDRAVRELRTGISFGVEYDDCSTTAQVSENQVLSILRVYVAEIAPNIEAAQVELRLSVDLRDDFELTGRWDVRTAKSTLRDLKTGSKRPPAMAQLGGYSILGKAHGLPINDAAIDWVPRAPAGKPQKPPVTIGYDVADCRAHAIGTLRRIKRAIIEFRETNDPEVIPSNPQSILCSQRWCPAYGTNFCKAWKR